MGTDVKTINMNVIKQYQSDFTSEQSLFQNKTYSSFKNGYINSCSDPYVQVMAQKLNVMYDDIQNSYTKIGQWWNNYISQYESIDKQLLNQNSDLSSVNGNNILNPNGLNNLTMTFDSKPSNIQDQKNIKIGSDGIKKATDLILGVAPDDVKIKVEAHAEEYNALKEKVHKEDPEFAKAIEICLKDRYKRGLFDKNFEDYYNSYLKDSDYKQRIEISAKNIEEQNKKNEYYEKHPIEKWADENEWFSLGVACVSLLTKTNNKYSNELSEDIIWGFKGELATLGSGISNGFGHVCSFTNSVICYGLEYFGLDDIANEWAQAAEESYDEIYYNNGVTKYAQNFQEETLNMVDSKAGKNALEVLFGVNSGAGSMVTTVALSYLVGPLAAGAIDGAGASFHDAVMYNTTVPVDVDKDGNYVYANALDNAFLAELAGGVKGGIDFYLGNKLGGKFSSRFSSNILTSNFINIGIDTAQGASDTPIKSLTDLIYKKSYIDENGNVVSMDGMSFTDKYKVMFEQNGGFHSILIGSLTSASMSYLNAASDLSKYNSIKKNLDADPSYADTFLKKYGLSDIETKKIKDLCGACDDTSSFASKLTYLKSIDGNKDMLNKELKKMLDTYDLWYKKPDSSSDSNVKIDPHHGYKLDEIIYPGDDKNFYTDKSILKLNNIGYMPEYTGKYIDGLFENQGFTNNGQYDIYVCKTNSRNLSDIYSKGLSSNDITYTSNPAEVTKILKIDCGNENNVDGALILKIPKGMDKKTVFVSYGNRTVVDPKYIDSFIGVDKNRNVGNVEFKQSKLGIENNGYTYESKSQQQNKTEIDYRKSYYQKEAYGAEIRLDEYIKYTLEKQGKYTPENFANLKRRIMTGELDSSYISPEIRQNFEQYYNYRKNCIDYVNGLKNSRIDKMFVAENAKQIRERLEAVGYTDAQINDIFKMGNDKILEYYNNSVDYINYGLNPLQRFMSQNTFGNSNLIYLKSRYNGMNSMIDISNARNVLLKYKDSCLIEYWTGNKEYFNASRDTFDINDSSKYSFMNFRIGNEPNYPMMNSFKIYLPNEGVKSINNLDIILNYMIKNNIASDNKIFRTNATDGICLRVYKSSDAAKLIDFINYNSNIDVTVSPPPFAKQYGKVGIAMDGLGSFNTCAASLYSNYIMSNNNPTIEGFYNYLSKIKQEADVGIYDNLPQMTNRHCNQAECNANRYQVLETLMSAINPNTSIQDYFSLLQSHQDYNKFNQLMATIGAFLR